MPRTLSLDDYLAILEVLAAHHVDFVVIGGIGAVLHGAPIITFDMDIVHSRSPDNVTRLLRALEDLDACYRIQPELRIRPLASHLFSPGHQLLTTRLGYLDVLGEIGANRGYDQLLAHTVEVELESGRKVRVLSLEMLIKVKEEAGRDKDNAVLPVLRQTLKEKLRRHS